MIFKNKNKGDKHSRHITYYFTIVYTLDVFLKFILFNGGNTT